MNISGGWTGLGREVCGACKRQPCERMCRPKKVEVHLEVGHVEQAGDDPLVALGVHVSLGPLVLGRLPAWSHTHPTSAHNCQHPVRETAARAGKYVVKDMWKANVSTHFLGADPTSWLPDVMTASRSNTSSSSSSAPSPSYDKTGGTEEWAVREQRAVDAHLTHPCLTDRRICAT